ncbi:MAG: DEAD/DEAH box helicase [bacterium]|nr:DEAD/DEAH box helicase [bacterium]
MAAEHPAHARFSPATRAWFASAFAAPTPAQTQAWAAIAEGAHVLVSAPTGSGKTLAAFLWAIDRLAAAPPTLPGVRLLYVSPLKALAVDIEQNLRTPLAGIRGAATRLGLPVPDLGVGLRTGDTTAGERRRMTKDAPEILVTTPESLFLLLTSAAREVLRGVETVIVDEVHAVAGTKRGSHLALSLERLDALLAQPAQRIGLSATVRPLEEVARYLGGAAPVAIVQAPVEKRFDLTIEVPVEDLAAMGQPIGTSKSGSASGAEERTGIWPHVEERLLALIRAHRSTIVFANSRRLAERLSARLNELAETEVARAHHGSVSREQRLQIEDALRAGALPCVVATSSLELGIDMGAVDLVVQVEAPSSVAAGLQRIGRAGHRVGATSRGVFFPKYRGDLLETTVVVERMRAGAIEALRYPRNPLDVLAQQIVAMVAMDDWTVDRLEEVVRRTAPFAELPRAAYEGVLDMLAGRYPSEAFAELRPRLNWDRTTNRLTPRPNAQRLAVTSGGTIPDRGLYGVFLAGEHPTRVGELDEEMVFESRVGEVFLLGASSWRIEDITHDRVLVSPAPGEPGKMPFWRGDAPGRDVELGQGIGAFVRELAALPDAARTARLRAVGLDRRAAGNLARYLAEQREATGVLPDDRTLVVERFRDAVGDWRVCIHSFFGARVHAPWARAIEARLRQRLGLQVQSLWTDDGIVLRIPDADDVPPADAILFDPEEIDDLVTAEIADSALFASRFRECAARALLLPRRRPGARTPLWQQRQRSALLLQQASKHPSFPIVLETYRECLQDAFDLPALQALLGAVRSRDVRVVEVDTPFPSPFASALQFSYVSVFMYEGDAPLAERRAQALSLDRALLAELLGRTELRELLDDDALAALELELQRLDAGHRVRDPDDLHDALRMLGDLSRDEVAPRLPDPAAADAMLAGLERAHRVLQVRVAGVARWIAIEDAARYRDALGVAMPLGVPRAFLEPVAAPLDDLVGRWARRHGPFRSADVAARFGLGVAVAEEALRRLEVEGRVVEGEFRPGGSGREWIDVDVLRRLRRRSLAVLHKEVEPVAPEQLTRFALGWHGVRARPLGMRPERPSLDAVLRAVEQLQGVPIPASALETQVLPARLPGYAPVLLDQLGAAGELVWAGAGALGHNDGWVVLALADRAPVLLPPALEVPPSPLAPRVLEVLAGGGALFFRQIAAATRSEDDAEVVLALWDLVWAGLVSNDTLAPLRAFLQRRRTKARPAGGGLRRRPPRLTRLGPPAGAGRWSLVPAREAATTRQLHAQVEQLLLRHGVVTRGAVLADRVPGGFAAVYPVLKAMEEAGRCRRGYFVEGLGGAQFAHAGAVDRLRAAASEPGRAQVLAATDPASPWGAALPWPERGPEDAGHRPGRKAGAFVVLVDGRLALYVERGGRTLLSYAGDPAVVEPAAEALAEAARAGLLGRLEVQRADGEAVLDTPLARALAQAGFHPTPWGMRVRA